MFMSLLVVVVLCMAIATSAAADVLVLALGVTREFACTSPPGAGYIVSWGMNGTTAATISSQLQGYIVLGEESPSEDGGVQRNLTYIADARTNNTHIRCTVTHLFSGELIVPVDKNIILQGLVSAPAVTYEMSSDHHSVVFSWSVPFTLNISDVKPDKLHYVVYIIRGDGHNDSVNTTDTHYELQADPCQSHQYHVEIAAVNVVGEGEEYRSPPIGVDGRAVADVSNTRVSFISGVVSIQMILKASPHCHEMAKYEVELNSTYSQDRVTFTSSGSAQQHTLSLNSSDSTVKINELYDCVVRIEGLPNSESTRMKLRTFDVQDVRVASNDRNSGYIDITCYFAEGSDAKECRIIAQSPNNAIACQFVATREDRDESTVTVTLPSGTYTLLVYDDEEGADNNPAFTIHSVQSSAQVSECATLQSKNNSKSNHVILIVIPASVSSIILIAAIVTAIVLTCVRKHKGKKQLHSDIEWNDYTSPPVQRSSSSKSTDSSRISIGSDSSEQSISVHSTGHSHGLQYAHVHITSKHNMTRPPPTSNDEPVNYAILQHQDTSSHSNKSQGTMDAGHLPGSYTPDDTN